MTKKYAMLVSLLSTFALNVQAVDVTSWAELKTKKNEGSIVFANDIVANGDTYPMPISFTSTTEQTINGGYHNFSSQDLYSDRWYYYSLSISKSSGSFSLKNMGKFSDGDADNNTFSFDDLEGNTIYKSIEASVNNWKGYFLTISKPIEVNITNSVFANNGKEKDAKLIYVSASGAGTLNITDSIFYNNTMANASGVVNGNKLNLNVEDSVFYNNHNATTSGAALYSNGIITVKNSYFINNVAEKDAGGAISLGSSAVLTIEGSKFVGNVSNDEGGAISGYSASTIALIKDSQFINNRNGGDYYDGGTISLSGGYIQTIDNVLFDGNRAVSKGGGLYEGMTKAQKSKPAILIKDSIFKNNEASTGGGFYTDASSSGRRQNYTYIIDSEFTNNKVSAIDHYMEFDIPIGGGLTSATGVPMIINNTVFSDNKALADGDSGYSAGGGIYFAGGSAEYPLKLVDSTFTNNSALEGGALFVDNADTAIIAATKDVVFSGNTAGADADDYNGGGDIYFQANSYEGTLFLNAADGKKVVFNGSIAAYVDGTTATIDINKSGVTYNTYDGETETSVDAGTVGEVQFNNRVGDETYGFDINLYGGMLSIGQGSTATNPDGLINDNNFTVAGASTLNTANGVIGEFSPLSFAINAALSYQFDVDLANGVSDKLVGAVIGANGSLTLSSLNIISDADAKNLKVTYSDTNIGGVLKDDYTITTSEATYTITAENDDTGSYLLFSKDGGLSGLPGAIANASDVYSITDDAGEVVDVWDENELKADLVINGNDKAITTENNLDGINVGEDYTLTMNNVSDMSGFNYAVSNEGTLVLNDATLSDEVINDGVLNANGTIALGAVSGEGAMNILSGATTLNGASEQGNVVVGNTQGAETTLNIEDTLTVAALETKGGATVNNKGIIEAVVNNAGTINNEKELIAKENSTNKGKIAGNGTLTIEGTLDNAGDNSSIIQKQIVVAENGELTSNNDNVSAAITNNGIFNMTGGDNNNKIDGAGTINISSDMKLNQQIGGTNTVNVSSGTLTFADNNALGTGVKVNANKGSTIDLEANRLKVNEMTFKNGSTLKLRVDSLSDFGSILANTINVENGANLSATLAQGLVKIGENASLQLLSSNNAGFNNFSDSFDNNMYHFEKDGNSGKYKISLVKTAEDVVNEEGGQGWVADAAKAYIDGNSFAEGSISAEIANKLADLAQNDSKALITEIKALAPTEMAVVQEQVITNTDRLLKTVDSYLFGERDPWGLASGDALAGVNVWAKPYVGKNKISSSHRTAGQKSDHIGVIAGVEKKINSAVKVGTGLHYDETDMDAFKRDIDIATVVGFVYGEYKPSNWFVNAVGSYGQSDYDEHKRALGSKYSAHYDVDITSLAAVTGYQFDYITPEVGLRYYHIERDGYKDAVEQYVHSSQSDYLRATAGVRLAKEYGIYYPNVYLGLGYDIATPKNNALVGLSNGTSYVVDGRRLSRIEYELNAGINARLTDSVTIGASYMGAYRKDYQEHTGLIKFKYDF